MGMRASERPGHGPFVSLRGMLRAGNPCMAIESGGHDARRRITKDDIDRALDPWSMTQPGGEGSAVG